MSWLVGKGSMLYNMTHLDEFQVAQERSENEGGDKQFVELETRKSMEIVPKPIAAEEEFVFVEDSRDVSEVESPPPVSSRPASVSNATIIASAYSSSKEDRGHRLGNFWNYPEFNPSSKRLGLLPDSFFSLIISSVSPACPLRYADLGCNEGELTLEFWSKLVSVLDGGDGESSINPLSPPKDAKALGVDIDDVLIERAQARALAGDLSSGASMFSSPSPSIIFVPGNITDKSFLASQLERISVGKRITLVSLFSTTMWIHIHLGDAKFFDFLKNVCGACEFFLVEPQPRKCYKNVNKRLRSMGRPPIDFGGLENLLQIEETIEKCILACGFMKCDIWGDEGGGEREERTHWARKLMLFKRVS